MSVIVLGTDELANMAQTFRALRVAYHLERIDVEVFDAALQAAHIANVGALAYSYPQVRDTDEARIGNVIAAIKAAPARMASSPGPQAARELVRGLRSLRYNCVSNNGTDFLPTKYGEILDAVDRSILDRLANTYR